MVLLYLHQQLRRRVVACAVLTAKHALHVSFCLQDADKEIIKRIKDAGRLVDHVRRIGSMAWQGEGTARETDQRAVAWATRLRTTASPAVPA